jgi:hypothetical protein
MFVICLKRHINRLPTEFSHLGTTNYYLPREPTDTQISSGVNIPRNLKAALPEWNGYYRIFLTFPHTNEVKQMLHVKAQKFETANLLQCTKEEFVDVSSLVVGPGQGYRPAQEGFYNYETFDSLFSKLFVPIYDDTYRVQFHLRATRQAIDQVMGRIQSVIDGEAISFSHGDMAHISFVEHTNSLVDGRRRIGNGKSARDLSSTFSKAYFTDFDMQKPCEGAQDYHESVSSKSDCVSPDGDGLGKEDPDQGALDAKVPE